MWISWNDPENVSVVDLENNIFKCNKSNNTFDNNYTRELINENKQLWMELKEKNEVMISLRDDIYFKNRELESLEKCKLQLEYSKNEQQYLDLMREINQLKNDQREKQILINFLNEMMENLCDEMLQNEHVECLEAEVVVLETENKKLAKENSEIKVKLKIVEYENDKLHTRCGQIEEENYSLKKKLEKTSKKLKDKENSVMSFKKFTELANNLQNRISRSKSENYTLKNVIERMKHVSNNYERLECENRELKQSLEEAKTKNEAMKEKICSLQENQLKINQNETITKPALISENQELKQRLFENSDKIESLVEENSKLKTSMKIYEKILIENKAHIKEQEMRVESFNAITTENAKLKMSIDEITKNLNREFSEKNRIFDENEFLRNEKDKLCNVVKEVEASNRVLNNDMKLIKRNYEEIENENDDLKKQLQIYRNTVQNQDAILKIRTNEMDNLVKENKELKLKIKLYENQIQMDGKVYKVVR
ncbi:hypothetical protein PGB90_007962 [Kerria lacca]